MSTYPPDYGTAVGKVRAYIPDIEKLPSETDAPDDYMFDDSHISVFLDANNGNVRLAAADACEVVGTSEALIAKVYQNQDQITDGSKMMGQFLARAKQLRDRAKVEAEELEAVESGFYEIPFALYDHAEIR